MAVVGTLRLGDRSIWVDEGTSISYAWRPLDGLWSAIRDDPNASLYYVLLWGWQHAFGDDVVVIRSLSLLFAALTVPALYLVGARLFGTRGGLVAAGLVTVNAFVLRHAQEARGYTLAVLLVTLASWLFVRQLDEPDLAGQIGYVAAVTLAIHAHYFAVFVLAAHLVTLAILRGRRALARQWLLQYGAIVLLCAPVAIATLFLSWNPIEWLGQPGLQDLTDALQQIAGDSFRLVGAAFAIWLIALPRILTSSELRRRFVLPALWLALPIVFAFAISQERPMFLPRYLIVCVPAWLLLTAGALVSLRTRGALAALVAIVVVFSLPPLRAWYRSPAIQDWKGLTAAVLDRAESSDGVVFDSIEVPFRYYAKQRAGPRLERLAETGDWSALARADNQRVWVVLGQPRDPAAIRAALERGGFRLQRRESFGETMSVEAFVRGAG